jgi:type II secretory pathway component PulF
MLSGVLAAEDAGHATALLVERGLHPIEVTAAQAEGQGRRPAARRDLAIVFQSLAALVVAGVPLERAVTASEGLARGALREALGEIRRELREGRPLSQALEGTNGLVPAVVVGMVRAGERGSQLGRALTEVAAHLEREAELMGRVRQALAYPMILTVAGGVSVVVITTVVVPKFAEVLGELGRDLPPATRALLGISAFLSSYGLSLLVGLLLSGVAFAAWANTPVGRERIHRALLGIPLLGAIRHQLATARLTRALGGMLSTGMPLIPALDGAGEAAGDLAILHRVRQARERIVRGEPLTASLAREAVLTHSALQLVAVGESSGQVGLMASRAADLTTQEADRSLRTLVGLLEPGLVVLFGGLVAFVAAALLQAVYSVRVG